MRNAALHSSWQWSARLREKLIDDGAHPSQTSTRHSDRIRVGVDTDRLHSDNNSITRVTTTWRRSEGATATIATRYPYIRDSPATTRGLDDLMACGRSDGATIRAEAFVATPRLDDSMAQTINAMSYDQKSPHRLKDLMMQWWDVTMTRWKRKLRCR